MNRMGFVNFWLYDDEVFQFADGRLLLRGANASGKSITTQSIIPFILDGDRTPGRLDPFGSGDRKMEYYFLGNGEKDDVTGYLFLEFKKEGIEQYRTIGIGQRAQRGKPMDFWGFIILDNRRIGKDLYLYKEVGDKKIPHTRQILKNLLGEGNPLVTRQREYMELVNKYLFAFPRLEQYNQFIQLMIKVRAPKLSRDFKPSDIYKILNESLQTLSDTDLRPMVEAMEKMDDIQARLEGQQAASKALKSLRKEYDKYVAYVRAQKGRALLQWQSRYSEYTGQLNQKQQALETYTAEQQDRTAKGEELAVTTETLKREKAALDIGSIQESIDRLTERRHEEGQSRQIAADLENKIKTYDAKLVRSEKTRCQIQERAEAYKRDAAALIQMLTELDRVLQSGCLEDLANLLPEPPVPDIGPVQRERLLTEGESRLLELSQQVQQGLTRLYEVERLLEDLSQHEEKLARFRCERDEFQEQRDTAQRLEDDCRDRLIEGFALLPGQLKELPLKQADVNKLTRLISAYKGPQDSGSCQSLLADCRDERQGELLRLQADTNASLRAIRKEIQSLDEELAQLRLITEAVPVRPEKVDKARQLLAQRGISFLPFYEAVEFEESTTTEEQALLEMQLTDTGLLDALVVAPPDLPKAMVLLKDLSDALIDIEAEPAHEPVTGLRPADCAEPLRQTVAAILKGFSSVETSQASIVLSRDGYYRHGLLEGHSLPEEGPVYLGRQARQAALQRRIASTEEERLGWENKAEQCRTELGQWENSLQILKEEYTTLPDFSDLDQSISIREGAEQHCRHLEEAVRSQEEETARVRERKQKADRAVIEVCRLLPYGRTKEAYEQAQGALQKGSRTVRSLTHKINDWEKENTEIRHLQEQQALYQEGRDDTVERLKVQEQNLSVLAAEITALEQIANSPENKEKARRYEEISRELQRLDGEDRQNQVRLGQLLIEIKNLQTATADLADHCADARQRRDVAQDYFREDLYIDRILPDTGAAGPALLAEAEKASHLPEALDSKNIGEMVTSLHGALQKNQGPLTEYHTALENYFDEDNSGYGFLRRRARIVSAWHSQTVYLHDFSNILEEAIDMTKALIQEEDRKLFEDVLSNTLSRKLSNRIAESKAWITDMSRLMMDMDTSMGLNFSLSWKARPQDSPEALAVGELEKLLSRDVQLLTQDDMDKVARHFRSRIKHDKEAAAANDETVNYADLVRDALDYRQWYEFKMSFQRPDEPKRELTNSAFNKFSGGEKALAMYVPLFAAVNAQYRKSDRKDYPRLIALDEAFAGVDDRNISSMFDLVQQLDFDYIMNSQALWGCYPTVQKLRIAELLRPANADVVTVINYDWNGKERSLANG